MPDWVLSLILVILVCLLSPSRVRDFLSDLFMLALALVLRSFSDRHEIK